MIQKLLNIIIHYQYHDSTKKRSWVQGHRGFFTGHGRKRSGARWEHVYFYLKLNIWIS